MCSPSLGFKPGPALQSLPGFSLSRVQRQRARGKSITSLGRAGTWGQREAPTAPGSTANGVDLTFLLFMGARFKPPPLGLNKRVSGKASVGAAPSVAPTPAPGSLSVWPQRAAGFSHPELSPW